MIDISSEYLEELEKDRKRLERLAKNEYAPSEHCCVVSGE